MKDGCPYPGQPSYIFYLSVFTVSPVEKTDKKRRMMMRRFSAEGISVLGIYRYPFTVSAKSFKTNSAVNKCEERVV